MPEGQAWGGLVTTFARENDPFSEKFRNSVPKIFMILPIYFLCLNFTDIVCREVPETMCCFADKKLRKMRFFGAILRRFGRDAKTLRESMSRDFISHHKISSQSVPYYRVIPEKVILYE